MRLNIIPYNASTDLDEDFRMITQLIDEEIGELKGIVNLITCDNKHIQWLNQTYRKHGEVTDVLSFTYYEGKTKNEELLGEVIISLPQAQYQAEELGLSLGHELYKLCIHGLLHLRGYDHVKDKDYRVMKLLEDKIMKRLLLSLES